MVGGFGARPAIFVHDHGFGVYDYNDTLAIPHCVTVLVKQYNVQQHMTANYR